jgi:hypothetical protein
MPIEFDKCYTDHTNVVDILNAIKEINPEINNLSAYSPDGTINNIIIDWRDYTPIPLDEIKVKMTEMQAEYDAKQYARNRYSQYPQLDEFLEAYTEKEIGGDSTKWDAYVVKYNKVRTDNQKP